MVDFKIPNICGASPELNDVLSKLADAKADAKAKLDEAASTAAAAFGEAQNELAGLKDKLQSIEIPTLPKLNLQAEIAGLASQIPGTPSFLSALAKIKTEFGDDIKSAGLELDSLVSDATKSILGGGDVCALVPNLQKEAGSDVPAVEEPAAGLLAGSPATTEPKSVSNDNAAAAARVADNKQNTKDYAVTNEAPTEDTGAIKIVESDKKIKSSSGGDVNVVSPGSGKNFSPDGGMLNRRSVATEYISLSQLTNLGQGIFAANPSVSALSAYKFTLKNEPIEKIKILLHFGPSFVKFAEFVAPAHAKGPAETYYRSFYGLHMYGWIRTDGDSTGSQNIKIDGKELTFSSPLTLFDHPGNIVSVTNERLKVEGFFRVFGRHPASFRKNGEYDQFYADDDMNRIFKGYAAVIEYEYLDNYDPEPQT